VINTRGYHNAGRRALFFKANVCLSRFSDQSTLSPTAHKFRYANMAVLLATTRTHARPRVTPRTPRANCSNIWNTRSLMASNPLPPPSLASLASLPFFSYRTVSGRVDQHSEFASPSLPLPRPASGVPVFAEEANQFAIRPLKHRLFLPLRSRSFSSVESSFLDFGILAPERSGSCARPAKSAISITHNRRRPPPTHAEAGA